jgi:hypothetical protein
MFYERPKNNHGLLQNPFKAIAAPRPIGWITTMSTKRKIRNGRLETAALQPIARAGYHDYAVVTGLFEMIRPK